MNAMKQQMARQFVQSEQFNAIISIFAGIEENTVESVQAVADAVDGVEGVEEIPTAEDRKAVIQQMSAALISDELPTWYVKNLAAVDNGKEAAQYVGSDIDELIERWSDRLRDQGVEGDDRELASAYVRNRYDVEDIQEFRNVVVEWSEERVQNTMRKVVAGGFETAQRTAYDAADALEEGEE